MEIYVRRNDHSLTAQELLEKDKESDEVDAPRIRVGLNGETKLDRPVSDAASRGEREMTG